MILQKLNGDLQDLCHSGWSQHKVYIKIMDCFYEIKGIVKCTTGNEDERDKIFFAIDTKTIGKNRVENGEEKGNNEN